ncbi:hypothetical protein BaRGS_00024992 [Batillaria attramentaria]|uniref:Uncharacterized protein n=1 Tax=Batillaria attramentaria TaxID=370345 RepID=A0ABD0K9I0_9CAEN
MGWILCLLQTRLVGGRCVRMGQRDRGSARNRPWACQAGLHLAILSPDCPNRLRGRSSRRQAEKVSDEVRRRRWNCIGHVLRREPTDDCAVALVGGRLREEGSGAARRQRGGGWWRLKETVQAGVLGTRHAAQP